MRVGILAPVAPEGIGGGYTLEREIFEQVLECAETSHHEFVVFEGLKGSRAENKRPNVRYVSLKGVLPARAYSALRNIAKKRTFWWEKRWIGDILKRERIEFFLGTSFEALTLDIPFLVIVWDLQHRLQPFFPEVSSGHIWQRRENFFETTRKVWPAKD